MERYKIFILRFAVCDFNFDIILRNSEEDRRKGHHDKASDDGEYEEKKGHKKKHFDDSG